MSNIFIVFFTFAIIYVQAQDHNDLAESISESVAKQLASAKSEAMAEAAGSGQPGEDFKSTFVSTSSSSKSEDGKTQQTSKGTIITNDNGNVTKITF